MKILGIIPARFQSSRLPGKPLVNILDKPLIIWVCEIVAEALGAENTLVATDNEKIANIVALNGYKYIMTSSNHLTGTDRLAEVSRKIEADIYLNIQGDEPMVKPKDIIKIAEVKRKNPSFIINAMTFLSKSENPDSLNIPKVIVNPKSELVYMSRLPVPGNKSNSRDFEYLKQVCIYAFTKEELNLYYQNPKKTPLEKQEDIEILRFLELGKKIKMVHLASSSLAVDVPSDIKIVEDALRTKKV